MCCFMDHLNSCFGFKEYVKPVSHLFQFLKEHRQVKIKQPRVKTENNLRLILYVVKRTYRPSKENQKKEKFRNLSLL